MFRGPEWLPLAPSCEHGPWAYQSGVDPATGIVWHAYKCRDCNKIEYHTKEK